ncbi:MAG: hypothetical protein ACFFAQ_16000 [Promethearchaeota archaeon]
MTKIHNVLFLCSGNTCRSPFAEYFAKWLKETKYKGELKGIHFDSAGLYHYYEKPQAGTLKYLNSKGINISDFKAKDVEKDLIENQDLILGFERKWHINKFKRKFKNIENLDKKVFLLMEFVGETENLEIKDPFYLDELEYNKVLQRIEIAVIKTIEKILKINHSEKEKE